MRSLFTGAWAKMSTDYFDLAGEGESPKHNQEANHPSTIKRRTTQTESGGEPPKHNQEANHPNRIRRRTAQTQSGGGPLKHNQEANHLLGQFDLLFLFFLSFTFFCEPARGHFGAPNAPAWPTDVAQRGYTGREPHSENLPCTYPVI